MFYNDPCWCSAGPGTSVEADRQNKSSVNFMQLVLSLEIDSRVSAGVRLLRCRSSAQSFCSEMFRTCCWKLFPAQCCSGQLGFLTLTGSTLEDYWADSGSDSLLQINGSDTRLV